MDDFFKRNGTVVADGTVLYKIRLQIRDQSGNNKRNSTCAACRFLFPWKVPYGLSNRALMYCMDAIPLASVAPTHSEGVL
jgi:hypothetical protein